MTDSKHDKISRWLWLPDWVLRSIIGGIISTVTGWILNTIRLRLRRIGYGRVLRRLAFWLLNPRVLAVALDIPSLSILFTTINAVITSRLAWGPGPMQITLLTITGIGISAPLLFTPNPKRRDSYIKF